MQNVSVDEQQWTRCFALKLKRWIQWIVKRGENKKKNDGAI